MEWRCPACGRPHEADSPPCRSCGHDRFERAVVRATKRCTTCGILAAQNATRCAECGFTSFEFVGEPAAETETSYLEWQCTECEHAHVRNNPPCSHCGHGHFEAVQVSDDDIDIVDYLPEESSLISLELGAVIGVVVVTIVVLGTGLVPMPGAGGPEWTESLDEPTVESHMFEEVNDGRTDRDLVPAIRNETLAAAASRYNRASLVGDREREDPLSDIDCSQRALLEARLDGHRDWPDRRRSTERVVAETIVGEWFGGDERDVITRPTVTVGFDVAVGENSVMYVAGVVC